MNETMLFKDVIRSRHSVRAFLPQPVPNDVIRSVLHDAQLAPSNCNTQPWVIHIVSGPKRAALSEALLAADNAEQFSPDFDFDLDDYPGIYRQRAREQGAAYYQAIGVAREATEDRKTASQYNLRLFGAPHVALLFMPSVGDNVRVAGDMGMYGQNFLLSLTAHGLGGVPQTSLGYYADTVRKVLGIDSSMKFLFGISFGFADEAQPANTYRIAKAPLEDSVTFHE